MSDTILFGRTQQAIQTPFDNSTNGFTADEVQSAIEEVNSTLAISASPGFSYGRAGVVPANTWLLSEGVPSNKSGKWVYVYNATVSRLFLSNDAVNTFTVEGYYHDGGGVNLTLLGSVTVTAAYGDKYTPGWSVPTDKQLALKLSSGNANNVLAGIELSGTTTP